MMSTLYKPQYKSIHRWSMAYCNLSKECGGIRMKCIDKKCMCEFQDHVLLEDHWLGTGCYPKVPLFDACLTSEQCLAVNRNTFCNRNNRCTCSHGFFFDGRDCIIRYDNNIKAQEVYKAAVVAAACFIVAIVGIFVACIVRRSFCRREGNGHHTSPANNDVFSISDEIAALRAVDKPPSYEEVLQIERTFFGIPPPEYSSMRGSSHRPNQNVISVISNYFRSETESPYLPRSADSATVDSPTPEIPATTTALNSPSNYSSHSTTTALISSYSETSCVNTIDTESTALCASSEDSLLKSSSNNPLLSNANSIESQLPDFFPVVLQPLTRHASLIHHSPPASRLSRHHHLLHSSTSLPSSPQLLDHLPHNSTFTPSTDLSSVQQIAPQTTENSHLVPSDQSPTHMPKLASPDNFADDLSLEESVNSDSRRDSLILCCEEAPSLTSYVNSAFVDDYQQQD